MGEMFSPEDHLQIELPTHVKDLNFENLEYPYSHDHSNTVAHIAYTKPFRVLSEEVCLCSLLCVLTPGYF